MRLFACIAFAGLLGPALAAAQTDVCENIRLTVSEQIQCRGSIANAMGDGDRARIRAEYEDRIRRENDRRITPPVLSSPAPGLTGAVPPPPSPAIPMPPEAPAPPQLPADPGPSPTRLPPPINPSAPAPDTPAGPTEIPATSGTPVVR